MVQRNNPQNSKSTKVSDISGNAQMYYPSKEGFDFTVLFTDRTFKHLVDTSYVKIEVIQEVYDITTNENFTLTQTQLPTQICGDEFPYDNQETIKRLNLQMATCVDTKDWSIGGNFFSNEYRVLKIRVK